MIGSEQNKIHDERRQNEMENVKGERAKYSQERKKNIEKKR